VNRRFFLLLALSLIVTVCLRVTAQTTESPLPAPTGYVNDYARVIDAGTEEQLETTLKSLDQQQHIQFAIVTVDSTNGRDIFDYSLAVARGWGLGAKDVQKPSLLLLVAIKDRKYYTQVSRHLESDLPDGLTGQIQRERLVPAFRAGDYGRGITDTINEYISVIADKRGFSPPASGTKRTPQVREFPRTSTFACCPTIIVIVVIIFLILIFLRRGGGRGFGGGGGFWTWLLVSSLLNSGGRSGSGWSGGGFGGFGGGSGGGSSGSFGGFGGGGDFGGGGSGGSW